MRKSCGFLAKAVRLSDGPLKLPPRNPNAGYKNCIAHKHIWTALSDGLSARERCSFRTIARPNRERRSRFHAITEKRPIRPYDGQLLPFKIARLPM